MKIGGNYGMMDTETGEREGMGEYGDGNFWIHHFDKIQKTPEERDLDVQKGEHLPYYLQCTYC